MRIVIHKRFFAVLLFSPLSEDIDKAARISIKIVNEWWDLAFTI
jgi:hypothetical protein